MNIDIILFRLAFGLKLVHFILSFEASIDLYINLSEAHHKEFIAQRKVYVDDHGAHDVFARNLKPFLIKISLLAFEPILNKGKSAALEVGIYK